jgi:hypothetical protein
MHRLQNRTYVGAPNETVTLDTQVGGSGAVNVTLDGTPLRAARQFSLKGTVGDQSALQIALFGAVGESCIVQISAVDGGSDPDLLLCQVHDPAPVHFYTFIVAQPATVTSLAGIRAQLPATGPQAAARKKVMKRKPRGGRKPR